MELNKWVGVWVAEATIGFDIIYFSHC